MTKSTSSDPWFPRGGDYIRATLERVAHSGASIKVQLFTKRQEDTGDGTDVDPVVDLTINDADTDARLTQEWGPNGTANGAGGLQELVRYRFTVTGTGSDWVLFRMLEPVWFDAVQAGAGVGIG